MTVKELADIMEQEDLIIKVNMNDPAFVAFIEELLEYVPVQSDFNSFGDLVRAYGNTFHYVAKQHNHICLARETFGPVIDLSEIELRSQAAEDDFEGLL